MTVISRPMIVLLDTAVTSVTGNLVDDVSRLVAAVKIVLQRSLVLPNATWAELIEAAAATAEWSHWRVIGLLSAAELGSDVDPAAARDVLIEVAMEMSSQGGLFSTPLTGDDSSLANSGRRRRDLITAMELSIDALKRGDYIKLIETAKSIAKYDLDHRYPGLKDSLCLAADDIERTGFLASATHAALVKAFGTTPFAAALPPFDSDASSDAKIARIAMGIRRRVLEHTIANDGGYLSQACSSAEIIASLYGGLMNLSPSAGPIRPDSFVSTPGAGRVRVSGAMYNGARGPELDRCFFSPAHYALVLYACLIEVGRLHESVLDEFNQDGSTVEMIGAEHSPGFETTTGSLAQALSHAAGVALARRIRGDTGRIWVVMSDGELQEGQTWEAVASMAHHRIDSVTVIIDVNGQQCDVPMDSVMQIEPIADRLRAFGATVHEIDGHDIAALRAASADREIGKPTFIVARTDPKRDMPVLANREPFFHYVRFSSSDERQQYRDALTEMQS